MQYLVAIEGGGRLYVDMGVGFWGGSGNPIKNCDLPSVQSWWHYSHSLITFMCNTFKKNVEKQWTLKNWVYLLIDPMIKIFHTQAVYTRSSEVPCSAQMHKF